MDLSREFVKRMFKELYEVSSFKGAYYVPLKETPGEVWYASIGSFEGYVLLAKESDLPNIFNQFPSKEYKTQSDALDDKNIYLFGCDNSKMLFEYYYPQIGEYTKRKELEQYNVDEFEIQNEIRSRKNVSMMIGRPFVRGEKGIQELELIQKVIKRDI